MPLNKDTAKDIIFYLLCFAAFCTMVYAVMYISGEGAKCMNSPLTYGLSQMSPDDLICQCYSSKADTTLLFNRDNISIQPLITSNQKINILDKP